MNSEELGGGKMKFNMETSYIPYSTIFEKRDMMFDWKETSNKVGNLGFIVAFLPIVIASINSDLGDFFEFSLYFSSIALVIGGVFCKKWKIWAYYLNIIALFYCNTIFVYYMSELQFKYWVMMAVADSLGIVMLYFCLRCIYNYNSVYKALEKEKGFPNFMVNGQDLYADKLYLKDEESSEKKKPANKNNEPIIMNIDVNPTQQEIEERRNKKHKHGKSILGINIIFPHDDPEDMSYDDKKGYMYDWNCNVNFITKGIFFPIMLMMAGALFCFIGEAKEMGTFISFIVGNLSVLLLVIGTNYMKMGKLFGAFVTILSLGMYFWLGFFIGAAGNSIPCTWILITSLINIKLFLPTVRYIINYPMYKELSKHEGFPSFVRNYADIYGSRTYIVEKQEPVKRKILSDNEKIEMNIGFDEKPKKEDKGWNAFDYMDEERKEENEN